MSLIITSEQEIKEYYASTDLSQSELKKLLKGIREFTKERESIDDKPHIIIGKAVDMILTGPKGEYEESFYVSKLEKKPTESVEKVVNFVYTNLLAEYDEYVAANMEVIQPQVADNGDFVVVNNDEIFDEDNEPASTIMTFAEYVGELNDHEGLILQGCNEIAYYTNRGAESRIKGILEPGAEYFKDLSNSFGKQVIDSSTDNTIQAIVMSLRTNPRTSKYFDREAISRLGDNVTVIYQMPIYFEYKGVACKALLDILVVVRDETGKVIHLEPVDLKTMNGDTITFPNNAISFRYDIQGAWYRLAISKYYGFDLESEVIAPFKFIVESSTIQGKPLMYEVSNELAKIGKEGRKPLCLVETNAPSFEVKTTFIKPAIKGYDELIDLYLFHEENGWDLDKEIIEADNAGKSSLLFNWEGIVSQVEE